MTTNEHALDILTFSESHNNQNSKNLFKRTTLTKPGANDENPGESLQTIPMVQVEEVLTYSNFPFSNKSQLSLQGTQEDLDKIFSLDKSNVARTMQIYGGSQISQGSLTLNKDLSAPNLDPENVYARNNSRANTQTTNKKSYAQSLDISNIEEKSEFVVESFGDKISPDASDIKIILSPSKDSPGPATPGMRYGKMSEEAAAMAFEARRKQLLETLSKASDNKKVKKSPSAPRKIGSTDTRRSPDQKSPIGNKTFANFEQKIGSVRKAALSKDYNIPPSPHFGRVPSDSSKPKAHQPRTRDDVAHLISWTPKSTQQSNRRSNSKNSNRSLTNLSSSFRDPEERAAVLTKLLSTKDQVKKEKRLNHSQQAALKGFTFGKDYSDQKDLYSKLNHGNEESVTGSQVVEEQEEHSPEPVPQEARSVQSVEIEGEEEEEVGQQQERNIMENTTYQSVYFSSRMRGQGKDIIMEDLDALDKEITKMETENREELSNSPQKRQTRNTNTRPQSAASTKNKWSLANSPIKISDNAEIQSAATPVQQKKLSPIKEENKGLQRGQRVASKESERATVQTEEEDVQPYEVLNERGYQGHYEFLHARAMIQKKNKDLVYKKNQQKKAVEELDQCTFTPKTISSPTKKDDIITKTKKWEAEREDKLVRNEMAIIEKEMQTCTFYPNNMLQTAGPGSHSFNNFFQRNTEWQKKKETKNKIREEKVYSSIMTSPKSNKETFITLSNSKDESPIHHTLPSRPTYSSPQNVRDNKPLKTCCEEKLTSLSSFKKGGHKPSETLETVSSPQRRQVGHGKQPSSTKKDMTSPKKQIKKEIDGSELKHDIAHSYKLLQQLKDTVKDTTAKNKVNRKQPQQQQEEEEIYDDFDFRLRTSGASFFRDSDGFTEHAKRATNRNTFESSPQPRLSAPRKIPLSSVEFDPAAFQPGDYLITQKNNKYYIQENNIKARSPYKTLKTSSSEQTLHSGSPTTAKSPNHSILSNRNSYRDSSAKKNKNVTINTDINLEYYDSGKGVTQINKSASRGVETNNKKTKKNSDVLKLHYVAKGIVELPQTTSLDKKYSELINKVHYVSGQLKTFGKGVYMSQI